MRALRWKVLAALAVVLASWPAAARAHWGVGIRIGVPLYYPGPYYGGYYYPYYYYPPPAVIVQPPGQVVSVPAATVPAAPPTSAPAVTRSAPPDDPAADALGSLVQQLSDPSERVRTDAVVQLAKVRSPQAVEPLTGVLARDRSPAVREAAARALGIIGSPASLQALQTAAQADDDRDVRHSSQFAAEIIRANLSRR
jgi:hypothetical protein